MFSDYRSTEFSTCCYRSCSWRIAATNFDWVTSNFNGFTFLLDCVAPSREPFRCNSLPANRDYMWFERSSAMNETSCLELAVSVPRALRNAPLTLCYCLFAAWLLCRESLLTWWDDLSAFSRRLRDIRESTFSTPADPRASLFL